MTKMQTLNDTELENVTGGAPFFIVESDYPSLTETHYHADCGGVIENVGDPLHCCVCSKCGEEHYFISYFKTYTLGLRKEK